MDSTALERAKERAIKDGIVALFDPINNVWHTNSKSEPGNTHKVIFTPYYLCDCQGFFRTKMCKHIAAVHMERLKKRHIWECPNCRATLNCFPALDVTVYQNHLMGNCHNSQEPAF